MNDGLTEWDSTRATGRYRGSNSEGSIACRYNTGVKAFLKVHRKQLSREKINKRAKSKVARGTPDR